MLKATAKRMARLLLGDFSLYRIYRFDGGAALGGPPPLAPGWRFDSLSAAQLGSAVPELADLDEYLGVGADAFGMWIDAELVGAAIFWHGERYKTRNFWPLADGEAKLVQITVAKSARGRGIAGALIQASSSAMLRDNFRSLYARVWHSNAPSRGAFEAAGWKELAFVVEVELPVLGRRRWVRWRVSA